MGAHQPVNGVNRVAGGCTLGWGLEVFGKCCVAVGHWVQVCVAHGQLTWRGLVRLYCCCIQACAHCSWKHLATCSLNPQAAAGSQQGRFPGVCQGGGAAAVRGGRPPSQFRRCRPARCRHQQRLQRSCWPRRRSCWQCCCQQRQRQRQWQHKWQRQVCRAQPWGHAGWAEPQQQQQGRRQRGGWSSKWQ